jgi:hypothetical protein
MTTWSNAQSWMGFDLCAHLFNGLDSDHLSVFGGLVKQHLRELACKPSIKPRRAKNKGEGKSQKSHSKPNRRCLNNSFAQNDAKKAARCKERLHYGLSSKSK